MGRKLADLWDYADRLDKRFKCRFCLKDFTGGVVRLRSHLSGVKGGGIRLCSKVSEEARTDALLSSSINVVNKKRKTRQSSSDAYGGSSDICDANCNREVGYLVANFFEMADIDYKMVESSSFINLINHLSPGSTLPSSLELQSKLIPSFKVEVEQYVSGAKQSWRETGCTLIPKFELNEKGGRSFLSIFGCSRDRTVLLNTFEVPTSVDSVAPFLEETVCSIVQSVGSQNIVQCVVDGSECGDYFSSFLGSQFPHVSLTKCAARELQLLFEEICRDVTWVGRTFIRIKSIVGYICSDTAILSLMRKYTNGKELKQQLGVINLLSSYEMLESVLKVKEDLVRLVQSPEWIAHYCKRQRGIEVTAYIQDPKTWELGEKVHQGLRSLFQVLCSVDFHDSGSGYLYGLLEIVEHSISQLMSNNQDMYQRLWDICISKKEEFLSEFHSVAAFLNPAYMLTEQAKDFISYPVITYILGRFIAEGDRQDFINEVEEYKKILSDRSKLYESTAAKAYHHPCKWWETFGQKLTILKNLAIRILSQPCSTSTCKRSMHTVEALQIKEQRELARGVMTDLDLKMNAILMERFNNDKACKREKIELEEFIKPRSNNGELTSRVLKELELRFMIDIESPVRTNRCVEGKNKHRIRICLIDPFTEDVVTEGIPSTLHLIISVVDGHFSTEASSDGHTRDYYNRNELSGECPYITGDLVVTLFRGEGTLGDFSFNCSSVNTESGRYRLAVKTLTGFCEEYRIREGISNDFTVEDAEEESFEKIMAIVDQQNGSFSSNPAQNSFDTNYLLIETHEDYSLQFNNTPNDPPQGFYQSLAQTAARRVKKKALTLQLRSRGREVTLKRGSQALAGKRREKKIPEPRRRVCSTGSNNVNQEENGDAVELKGIDSLSSTAAMTLFGVKGASLSSAKPVEGTNEVALTTHPSTALQLSLTGGGVINPREVQLASVNDIDQQEDALKGVDSTYMIASVKPESPAIRLFGVKVAGSAEGETHEGHSPTTSVIPTTEDSKEISYIGVRKRPLGGRYDAEIQEPGKKTKVLVGTFDTAEEAAIAYDAAARQFLGPYAKENFLITSKPEINSTTNEDDSPTEVEENRCAGDNCKSDSSVQSTPTKKRVIYTDTNNHGKGIEDYEYDVFMSFRGADTRHSIAKILYQYMVDAEIKAFVDNKPATLSGDLIDQAVINAIDKSKISICIFSETFASSAWCLREVEKMVQLNKVILPVFYGVAPDDVQLKTNKYTDDLARHETKYDKVEVQKWREALRKVAKLEGFQLDRMSLLASLNKLIGVISSNLKVKPKYELQDFVGMEDHVKSALSLLDIESWGKRILGVFGMGGMGKTTLAKCVYNQVMDKFDMCFFLEEDSSLETEMTRMRSLCQKRVLIVLDDVHNTGNPIAGLFNTNWFGSGSRIIVTTRNRKFLEKMENVFWYDMEGMDPERALKLFSKKAFGQDSPPQYYVYQRLSKQVVCLCEGHPLALTVVGTFLHGQEKLCWERVITDMQQTGGQYPPDVIEDSFPDELCRGRPLVVRLMTSLHKGIEKQQLWESKVDKVTKVLKAFQEMMTGCKKINAITEAFGEMFTDIVRLGPTGGGSLKQQQTSSSRRPKTEMTAAQTEMKALIQLTKNMESKYLESGPKGPQWEEISAGMKRLGYDLSSKRCKEKWENIIKHSKKVKKLNTRSVTTQRRDFKQLDPI